jgi:hypothetical protein
METSNCHAARIIRAVSGGQALLAVAVLTASCRQIAGIQDLPKPCGDSQMIDDLEDGDGSICTTNGRQGAWFGFGDGTSGTNSFVPNASTNGTRGASQRAVHFSGSGYTAWGAITGFNLDSDGVSRKTYDATGTGGVTFWMKSDSPVDVQFPTVATTVVGEGGTCVDGGPDCNAHFQFSITAPAAGWTQYRVPFTALRQFGAATWNPAELLGIQFHVGNGDSFDFWLDDLAFYFCASTECTPTCTDADLSLSCPKGGRHAAGCFPRNATCAIVDGWCANPALVDDMEDGDELICASPARQGHWYTFSDDPKSAYEFREDAIAEGREASRRAAHLVGAGLIGWGAGIGMTVSTPGLDTYDASAAGGIHFWMRGSAPFVRVQFRLPETTPTAYSPGTCVDAWNCDNHFYFGVTSQSDDWTEYRVPFSAVRQAAGGTATWNPARLIAIEFSVVSQDFDVWIDDVSFYSCTGDACVPTCHVPRSPVACPAVGAYPAGCWPADTDCAHPKDILYNSAVWGSGANDVWIAGYSQILSRSSVLHFDGTRWSSVPGPTAPALLGVWGSAPNDAWATGVRGTILRWTGSNWTTATTGNTANLFQGLWGSSANDVWAAGAAGTLLHWNGNAWSASLPVTSQDLWGLWGSGPDDVWAVGTAGSLLRRTAAGWSVVAASTTRDLDGVWGTSSNDVWVVGDAGTILHWNGTTWSSMPTGTSNYLDGVWGSAANDVWVVGDAGTILHWNGTAWSNVQSGTQGWLAGVWGSSASDVWAVGSNDTILHFDGLAWTPAVVSGDSP